MSTNFGIENDTCARMTDWRHDLHANPETAFEEHRTAQIVADALMEMQIAVDRGLGGTGVVGTLKNGGTGIADYHDFASKVPAALQSEVKQVQADIESGAISITSPSQPKS